MPRWGCAGRIHVLELGSLCPDVEAGSRKVPGAHVDAMGGFSAGPHGARVLPSHSFCGSAPNQGAEILRVGTGLFVPHGNGDGGISPSCSAGHEGGHRG